MRATARGFGQCVPDFQRQGESGVCGENGDEAGAFHQGAELGPTDRAVVGVRAHQMLRQTGQDGVIGVWIDPAHLDHDRLRLHAISALDHGLSRCLRG